MAKISDLCDELLVKILSYLPTKVAISTSVLSIQWEFLWMWSPKLEYDDQNLRYSDSDGEILFRSPTSDSFLRYREFVAKYLPLHRAPVIESLRLNFFHPLLQPEDLQSWVGFAVSCRVRKLSIGYFYSPNQLIVLLPSSLYTCNSLVILKLNGPKILVDVPGKVCLPSLKTLRLDSVIYANEDSLQLLISYSPVLEDLTIEQYSRDNLRALVIIIPSLLCLSLSKEYDFYCDAYVHVIKTPSLEYLQVTDGRDNSSYLIEHMPELVEADIFVKQNPEKLLGAITSVKLLTLQVYTYDIDPVIVYHAGIVFNQLEDLNLIIRENYWSRLLVWLLKDSPKLQILNLENCNDDDFEEYESVSWDSELSSVPECLLKSLKTFEFKGYEGSPEERDFLSYIFKHARYLKSVALT